MRRTVLSNFLPVVVVVAVIAGAAGVAHGLSPRTGVPAEAAANSPWAQSDANASDSRVNLTETTLTTTTVKKVVYRRSLAQPPDAFGNCSSSSPVAPPALSGGKLYTAGDGYVSAFTASTGAILWQTLDALTDAAAYHSIAVGDGFVYVSSSGCQEPDDEGNRVTAFNATTGKRAWQTGVPADGGRSMQLSGNYVVVSGSSQNDGQVTEVVQAATGNLVWDTDNVSCGDAVGAIVVAAEVIWNHCSETGDGTAVLEADTLSTGKVLWTRAGSWTIIRGDNDGAATGHHIFALNGGVVNDINPKNGATRYTLTDATTVLADDTRIYASCTNGLCAFDTATGTHEWTVGNQARVAAEADGVLYLDNGEALMGSTGAFIKQAFPGSSEFAVGDGRIAVISDHRIIDLYGLPGS
jgi:outer membrane protein assembly factor BamB